MCKFLKWSLRWSMRKTFVVLSIYTYIYTYICISKYLFQCYKNSSLLGELTTEASAGRLNRTFRRGPKAASSKLRAHGVCHLCRAGQEGYDFEDMPLILEI